MLNTRRIGTWLLLAALTLSAAASAQSTSTGFNLERLDLNPSGLSSLVVGGGETLAEGRLRLTGALHYQDSPLVALRNGAPVGTVVKSRFGLHLLGAFGATRRLEVGLGVPVVLAQSGDDLQSEGIGAPASPALGSPVAYGRFQLLDEDEGPSLSLAGHLGIELPVGSRAAYAGGGVGVEPRLLASRRLLGDMLAATVELGFAYRSEMQQLKLGAALATLGDKLRAEASLRAAVPVDGQRPGYELLVGARYPLSSALEGFILGGPGLGSGLGVPKFRVLIGAAFGAGGKTSPGLPSAVATCQPGDRKGLACPELDDDADGLRNGGDRCVLVAEDPDGFDDGDGCPEADNDRDGLDDGADRCPLEAGLPANQGCPIPDQDRDGVADAADRCVREAGPAERQGCPFRDPDQDGIESAVDGCPDVAGPPEARGCPVVDTDGDGVSDHVDNCKTEQGPASNQGCPAKTKQLVVITLERLEIKDKVYFASGKSEVLRKSFKLLDQIARVIREHPEIPAVHVEGHTDDRGDADLNRKLSQARAEAVVAYLVKAGVDAARLVPKGYGPDRPAAANNTAKGREMNRRVEFNIPKEDPALAPAPSSDEEARDGERESTSTPGGNRPRPLDGGTSF